MENQNQNRNYLAEFQAKIKVPKKKKDDNAPYKSRSAEDILEAAKPIVNAEGFSIGCTDDIIIINERYYIKSTAIITNGTITYSATALAREPKEKLNKYGAEKIDCSQITGATSSYARKYALGGLLGIDDEKDSDLTHDENNSYVNQKTQLNKTQKSAPGISDEEKENIRFQLGELINAAVNDTDFNKIIEDLKKNTVIANNKRFKGELWATINNAAEFNNLHFNTETKRFEY